MVATPDKQDAKDAAHKLFLAGETSTLAIARKVGCHRSTVSGWVSKWRTQTQTETKPADVRDMQIAALESQLRQLKAGEAPIVTPLWNEQSNIETLWKAAEVENEKRIERALAMAYFTANLPAEPCAITFISDQHISTGNVVDLKRMREDAELVAQTPGVYAILGGDATDNHLKHRAAIMAARSQPDDQWRLFEYYLSIFASKVLVAISGNHDDWSTEIGGIDVLRRIAQQQRVCFAPDEARITANIGDQTYKLAVRHQYRMNSSFNLGHAVKQWWRNGDGDFDIGCICHHHEPHVESFNGHGEEKWCCRPGAYQVSSAYSRKYGFNSNQPTCPTFLIYPDRKEIVGFRDIRPALRLLKAER